MREKYFAVMPASDLSLIRKDWTPKTSMKPPYARIRIEKAATAGAACQLAFGRGVRGFVALDLGTRVGVIRNQKQLGLAVARGPWVEVK